MSNGHIWLEKRVKELETKLEEVSKDRDDWAKKYQEYGCYKLVTHNDGTITVTQVKDEK
jgi:hypothetical protein